MSSVKADDLQYTHVLWFEDEQRRRLELPQVCRPSEAAPSSRQGLGMSQDVYTTEYYDAARAAVAKAHPGARGVQCVQMMLVHLAVVPFKLVLDHAADIAAAAKSLSE